MASSCGLVPSIKTETRCFPHRTAHLPHYHHHHHHKTNKMQDCHNVARTGSTDTTIQWHRYIRTGWQAAAGAGRGRRQQRHVPHSPFRSMPLWAGLRQCLLVIIHFAQGRGEETPRTGLKGPEGGSERGTLSWLDVCRRLSATTFTRGQSMARSNLIHAEWQGGGLRGPRREINSTHSGIL